ncbi:MAG TPA: toll/interleukin-1 receptor domain-containing protein [Pyrinomonadaceae bacterium]|nr:toll/interleukin-1 receptor domain-containing protein [Pyrinomonadaceae bacterium]
MNKVFLSHNSKDKPFVRMLAEDIKASGVSVWIDEVEILVGDSLIRKISEGLVAANYVVAVLSKNSVESKWVKEELEIAATLGIEGNRVVILPLRLDDCVIPTFLIHRLFIDFQQAVCYDEAFCDLLRRIHPEALPESAYSFYSLTIGATRKDRLVRIAKNSAMKDWILDYLIGTTEKRESHKERHFIYLALGEVGGKRAETAIKKGLLDRNAFARSGAEKAWKLLGH